MSAYSRLDDAFCVQKILKINSAVVQSGGCGHNQSFHRKGVGELYFYLNSQKQGPFRMSGLFVRPILDYLERNEWIEIIRRSRITNISPLPLHPVFFVETIQTNRKKYELKTKPEYLLLMHFGLLFFFHFDEPVKIGQEINFDVDICSHYRCGTNMCVLMLQKQVLTSHDPSYLILTLETSPNVRISNFIGTSNGILKVYWTKAHSKLLGFNTETHGAYEYLCHLRYYYYRYISAKYCFPRQHFIRHNYIYYFVGRKTSWNEAFDYCKSKGGNLPVVRSREEYHGLLTLLMLPNKYSIPIKLKFGIYLGLKIQKVSNL